ncbi:MAG TPA: RluA family pseudouridine synthase [Candidatus Paceibacterota bacterium]|nr:RluA family pseudouridine synthase [Candidatus Paceibacterota bacterium]
MIDIKILYEDNHLIAVYKPAGILVIAGQEGHNDDTLYWQLKQFIKERDQKPGNVFLGVLHRLDRPVSGIVIFAKTSKGAARLSEQFRERTIEKTYQAVIQGKMEPSSGTLRNVIRQDINAKKAIEDPEGNEAVLHYETLSSKGERSLLKIQLETGRYHQIRAQLALAGHPIVGDVKYGYPEALPDKSIMLCAVELSFETATSGERKTITISAPESWSRFAPSDSSDIKSRILDSQ